jgi:hypothetical protein
MNTVAQKRSNYKIALITIGIILAIVVIAGRGKWVLFYDTSIAGSVVDAETGKPLEKVIVVGMWQLSQFMSQGFGGYAKIVLVETDKDGRFKLPWWVTFKPWTFWSTTRDGAPQVIIYKPGYKLLYTGRDAWTDYDKVPYLSDAEIALAKKQQEGLGIKPARLKKTSTDQERIENYRYWGSLGDVPGGHYSKKELKIIYNAIEDDESHLSGQHPDRQDILDGIKALKEAWAGGKK